MTETNLGDSRKIKGLIPKMYIKDSGTDYDTGEAYNGLWSAGTVSAPTGYADFGHWLFLEETGNLGFNNRIRSLNSLFLKGIQRSSDRTGTYISYAIPGEIPLPAPSPYYYMMMGLGGSAVESSQFKTFLQTPGFNYDMRLMFDQWLYFKRPPQNNGERQVFISFFCEAGTAGGATNDHIMAFGVRNDSGTLKLFMEYCNDQRGGSSVSLVDSITAANLIYPGGFGVEGGLHNIGFIFDRLSLDSGDIKFALDGDGPEGFYVDGNYIAKTGGDTTLWTTLDHQAAVPTGDYLDTNPLIGCEIDGQPTFNEDQSLGLPSFKSHILAKMYSMSLTSISSIGEITEARMNTLHNLRFNIPRGPSKVDFSERFEYKGKNLLQDMGTIKQVLESRRGHFHITVNSVKARN